MPRHHMQELEEELLVTRQDLEDAQTNNATIEEDLSETQVIIREGVCTWPMLMNIHINILCVQPRLILV